MSYFPGVFITQYHKSRAGYFINHDSIMNGSSLINLANAENRKKLIFYYIAENVPQKLKDNDDQAFRDER